MLPDGLEKCPRCGKKLPAAGQGDELSGAEIRALILYVLRIVLIPVGLAVLLGIVCILLLQILG
jgi:hypothetical protein